MKAECRNKDREKRVYLYVINVGDKLMAITEYTPEQEDPKLNEPLETYLEYESDTMTDEELEEELSKIPFRRIPGLAYTYEERKAELEEAMAKHLRGEDDSITHEEFLKELEEEGW